MRRSGRGDVKEKAGQVIDDEALEREGQADQGQGGT